MMIKNIFLPLSIFAAVTLSSCGGNDVTETATNVENNAEETCFYSYEEGSATVRFTAFKTTEKIGVGGQFDQVNVTAGEKSTKITDVLNTIKFNIKTGSVNTNDEGRDAKLVEFFFGKMNETDMILGQVKATTGDNTAGVCTFYLTLNGVEKEVAMDYTVTDDNIKLSGAIDLTDFNGLEAVESINTACKALHTGADGVSKTWPNVDLVIEAKLTKDCH